jgi:hypothetical protein
MNKYLLLKIIFAPALILLIACNGSDPAANSDKHETAEENPASAEKIPDDTDEASSQERPVNVYANERFREVTVQKTGYHKYLVQGKAQVFEATLNWVVEDGHNELQKGFATADAGGPEWGNFNFTIDVEKENPNSTLHLILFEASAKDGSRQYELPIPLE